MRFVNFIKKNWKTASILCVIAIATVIGVVVVRAASVTLTIDHGSIIFNSNVPEEVKASVTVTADGGDTTGAYSWSIGDDKVANVSGSNGTVSVAPVGAGITNLTVVYSLTSEPLVSATQTIPVTVPLTIDTSKVSNIIPMNSFPTVTTNAAASKQVVWTSSNERVVSVNSSGDTRTATLIPVSGGTARITATISGDGLSASFDVRVGVSIIEDSISVKQGNTAIISTNSNDASSVYWWSENNSVATVENGMVTGVYAGTTTIYASCMENSITDNAGDSITVNVPYEVLSPATTMQVGDSFKIPTTANPAQMNCQSNDTSVIEYDSSTGYFIAKSAGTATVSVRWTGEASPHTYTITVMDGFSLSSSAVSLNIGSQGTVTATATNNSPITWTIADESMATVEVSEDTLTATVTALALGSEGNYTTLVATQIIDGIIKTASCRVYVLNPVNSISLLYNGEEITNTVSIPMGNSIYITAYLNMDDSAVPDNTSIRWISSDENVIMVTPVTTTGQQQRCEILAKTGGTATITAVSEDGLYVATANIYVTENVTSVTLDQTSVTAQMALEKYQLTATVLPQTSGVNSTVLWESLDTSVVTVDQNGLVTFVSPGTVFVIATSAADTSKRAYCSFTITQQVESVTMDYDSVELNVGDQYRLTAVVAPATATNQNVVWSSSDDGVVTVDATGMITATGSGSATIVIQTEDGGYIDMTNVRVHQPVSAITLSSTEMSVKKGTEFWLSATVLPENADNKNVVWTSSDTSLATVAADGKVTTLACGTVTISCVSADNSEVVAYCVVEITEPVTGLTLNTYYQNIVAGTRFVIVPTVLPIDAINKAVTYTSSDASIASVDANGIVSGIKGGTCEIIVTTVESNLTATCTINVIEYVTSVAISGNSQYLNIGNTMDLTATVETETATNKSVVWTSSNNGVASVNQSGRVTGISDGSVVITATAADGSGVAAAVVIRVINPISSISLNQSKVTINVGETIGISATINPSNASITTLQWISDDETIAKVYPDGDVEGISEGRTIIHATSTDGNEIVASCTIIVKPIVSATSISINSDNITMLTGKTRTLTARMYPTNTNESIRWESSDTSIVTVDGNGRIVTVGPGDCVITAYSSSGTVQDTCTVYSMAINSSNITLEQYNTFNLFVDGAPSAASWRTSNPRIATVTQGGVVTSRMPGTCTITATVDGKTLSCRVTVVEIDENKFINVYDLP